MVSSAGALSFGGSSGSDEAIVIAVSSVGGTNSVLRPIADGSDYFDDELKLLVFAEMA